MGKLAIARWVVRVVSFHEQLLRVLDLSAQGLDKPVTAPDWWPIDMGEHSPGTHTGQVLRQLALVFDELGQELRTTSPGQPFDAVTRVAQRHIAGADAASVTTYRNGKFSTVSATDDLSRMADAIQYELRSGPCVDAIVDSTLYNPRDLGCDPRWPSYAAQVSDLGIASMLSYRLRMEQALPETIAGLNLYSAQADAFDETAVEVALLLATYAAAMVSAEMNRGKAQSLERGLDTNRDIGVAMGVLINRHNITRAQAFNLLRIASQNLNRKINDLALEVAETGLLPPHRPTQR